MTLTVISGKYQKVLLISTKYCTNISCTLIFLGFVFESGNCVVVCVVLKLKSEKVFWDAILKFILITKLLYANFMHCRMPGVICCKRNENTRKPSNNVEEIAQGVAKSLLYIADVR